MKETQTLIHVEQPEDVAKLTNEEMIYFQHKHGLSEVEILQAFQAVGSNKEMLEEFLGSNTKVVKIISEEIETPSVAVNPNPGANANIQIELDKLSPKEIQEQSTVVNHEVTDGECG